MTMTTRQKETFQRVEQVLGGLIAVIIAMTPVCVIWTLNTQSAVSLVTGG